MMRALLVFEGGGAKGIAHLGALRVFEKNNFDIVGWSGTSAGAIIATLGCVGFKSSDLVHEDGSPAILTALKAACEKAAAAAKEGEKPSFPAFETITDLLGRRRWQKLNVFRAIVSLLANPWVHFPLGVLVFALTVFGVIEIVTGGPLIMAAASTLTMLFLSAVAIVIAVLSGFATGLVSLQRLRRSLNMILLWKLYGAEALLKEATMSVTFADLRNHKKKPLKIVATDITNRAVRVFSAETTPEMAVADAVCASICIPLIFKPMRLQEPGRRPTFLLDGGLISNLPVWTLDDERTLDPDALTIAVTLVDPSEATKPNPEQPAPQGRFSTGDGFVAAIRTIIFGSAVLDRRGVAGLKILQLPVDLDLLEFDASREKISKSIDLAAAVTEKEVALRLIGEAESYQEACRLIQDFAVRAFELEPGAFKTSIADQRVRAALIFLESSNPDGVRPAEPKLLRLRHGYDFKGFLDLGISLPLSGSIAGEVLIAREERLYFTTSRTKGVVDDIRLPPNVRLDGPGNEKRRMLIPKDVKWILSIPIFVPDHEENGDRPRALVVSLDGTGSLNPASLEDLEVMFGLIIGQAEKIMYDVRRKFIEADKATIVSVG